MHCECNELFWAIILVKMEPEFNISETGSVIECWCDE